MKDPKRATEKDRQSDRETERKKRQKREKGAERARHLYTNLKGERGK